LEVSSRGGEREREREKKKKKKEKEREKKRKKEKKRERKSDREHLVVSFLFVLLKDLLLRFLCHVIIRDFFIL